MTNGKQSDERAIFLAALEQATPPAREAYLQGACAGNPDLLRRLRELLAAHEASQGPFDAPPPGLGEGRTIDAPRLERPGMQIGPYKLLQQIGEGGMGVVYMAEQHEPVRRKVALKIIKPGMDTRQVIARFEAERQALSLMDHPNIARVLDAGTTDVGRPYFVMELVKGQPITEYCDEHHLSPRQRLEMLLPVCQAIQHAHQKGIIHRDIKPSNVLVAEYDQQAVPKVIDFGVAKATSQPLTERTMFTDFGQVVGTLEYMSPEQAKVNQLDIDTRSDIYSLGVLLYELLTGTTPFDKQRLRSAAWDEMLRIIREEEPPKPSTRLSTIDTLPSVAANRQTEPGKLSGILRGELDWIVMKALDKDRNRRYETANGLAMDLLRYLHDEPVVACPPSTTYRFRKFARRNRAVLLTGAMLAGALLLGTTISIWQAIRATTAEREASQLLTSEQQAHREAEAAQQQEAEQRRAAELAREQEAVQRQVAQQSQQQAEQERQRAEENYQKANQFNAESVERLTRLYVRRGTESVERSDFTSALPWFLKALDIDRAEPQREAIHRLRIATTLDRCPKLTQLIDPGHRVETIDFLPGGRRVLLGGEGKSSVWELPTGSAVDLQLQGYFCQLSPDSRQIVELAKPGIVRLRDSSNGQVTHELPRVSQRPRVAGFSADSRRLFVIHEPNSVQVWDATTGQPTTSLLTPAGARMMAAGLSPSGHRLVAAIVGGGGPDLAVVYDTESGALLHTVPLEERLQHSSWRDTLAVTDDWFAVRVDCFVQVVRLDDGRLAFPRPRSADQVRGLTLSPDQTRIVSWGLATNAHLWDAATGAAVNMPLPGNAAAEIATFSPDGTQVAVGFFDGEVHVWRLSDGGTAIPVLRHPDAITCTGFSPDGRRLVTASRAGGVRVYDLATARGAPELTRRYDGYAAPGVTFSSDAHTMYVAGFEDAVFVHDVASRKLVVPPLRHTTFTFFGGVTPDGTRLVTGGLDGTIALHDAASGSRVFTYTGCRQRPSAPGEGADLTQRNEPYSGQLRRVWVDAAGRYIFGCMDSNPSGYPTKSLLVALDATTGRPHAGPLRLASNILAETVTPDGRYWILGLSHAYYPDAETCIEIRSLPDLQLVRRLPLTQKPRALATSRDGTRIVVGAGSFNEGGLAQVLSLETLGPLTPEIRFRGVVERVQFLHDDRHFLTASWDGAVRVWDAQTAQPAAPEIRVGRRITALAVHPEEHWIATGTGTNNIRGKEEQEVRYWDLRTGEPISPSFLHGNRVMDLTFAPDGARLASTSRDFNLRIWTLPQERRSFEELQALVQVTTGATLDAADNIAHLPGDTFREVWRRLVEQSRDDLAATPGEEDAWHRAHLERAASRNDLASAVEHVAKLIELDPTDADLYRHRLILNAGLDRWDQVPVDAQLFVQLRSLRGGELGQWAELIASLGPTPATLRSYALGLAAQGIEQAPDDPDAYAARAHLHARDGQWDEAADDLTRATELDPGNFRHWYELALVQRRAGQMEAAAVTCRRMRQAVPRATASLIEDFVAWTANLCDPRADDWEEVVARAQWAVEREPFDIQRIVSVGAAHYRAGNLDKAWQDLDRAHGLLKEPSSRQSSSPAYLWYFLAMTSHALGQADDARTWFEKAVQFGESLAAESEAPTRSAVAWNREVTLALLRAEAEKLLATDPNGIREPRLWQARARWYLARGNAAAAETALDRAVELAGDDPMPWIHRGRWSAERGEHEKADADFAHAVSLRGSVSSEGSGQGEGFELNKFLEAGWWVVGPYPAELKEFCPPEVDPDPARPVHVIDPQTGLSDQPVKWRSVPTTQWGRVDLTSLSGQKNRASAYALSHVYSPDERTVLLMIHKSRPLRLWVNGAFIEDYVPGEYPVQPHYEHFHRVPIVLRSGRNTILVKTNTPDFYVRIGDTPRDRAILLAEQQRFAEAAQVFNQLTPADQLDLSGVLPSILANVLALEGNHEQHERLCAALIAWAEPQPASTRHAVAYFCAQTQNHVFDAYAELLVAYADEYAAANREQWVLLYTALVNYRAGRYERASTLLNEANWNTHDLPLRAMLAHQSGKRELAQKTLDEALAAGEVDESFLKEHNRTEFYGKQHFCWWYDWATFVTLLTEAEQTIRGQTTQSDGLKQRCEAIMAQKWAESPETAPFDQAMLFASRDGAGQVKYGQPYLARGKRLAALSRFDEAEADFNKAVELAPTDPDVLTRRALFFAERDDPQRAAADFDAALTLIEKQNPPRWLWGRTIDAEVAGRASVYDALQALRPTDGQLLSIRIISRLRNGERESLAAPCRQLEQFGFQPYLAAVHLLRGDRVEFERLRATDAGDAYHRTLLGGLAPTDETMTRRLLAAAEELERQGPRDRWQRRWIGLAQLRAGRLEEAKTTLLGCLVSQSAWQTDSIVWPLLAITCHQLGETAESQRWWQKSEIWLRTLERLPPAEWSRVVVRGFSFEEWLLACVFHREAKALIETAADPTQPLPASVPE